jgi:hypothetical protein
MELDTIDQTSEVFLGQWKKLVSTTNWDKGRIIHEWRQALVERDVPVTEYSDEAWSQRVGNVTPQHVGRLRRVFERFGVTRESYAGLYWSHFQAALDWDDAELWLEGAAQNDWSVSQMRKTRWEAMGAVAQDAPQDSDIVVAEVDEDVEHPVELHHETSPGESVATVKDPADGSADDDGDYSVGSNSEADDEVESSNEPAREPIRPFAELPSLPSDVADAFESFKLAILRHRLTGWQEISLDDMLGTLDALKELASAPLEEA